MWGTHRTRFGTASPKVQDQLEAHQRTADRQAKRWVTDELRDALRWEPERSDPMTIPANATRPNYMPRDSL